MSGWLRAWRASMSFFRSGKIKHLAVLPACFAMVGIAQANLLSNGDFAVGTDRPAPEAPGNGQLATDWTQWLGGGWNNRETNPNGLTPDNYHLALGNAGPTDNGAFQIVPATAGLIYQLEVDSGSPDAWWKPNGEAKLEFLAADDSILDSAFTHWEMPDFDVDLPWQTYSVVATAPAGTTQVKAILMNQGPNGGTMRFDNADLSVVPEPVSLVLLGLAGLMLAGCRRR